MGECGCGEFTPYEAYTVGDYVLAVELYRGCRDCGTGLIVSLHLMTPEEAKEWDVEIKGDFKPGRHGSEQIPFPLVGKDDLVQAARELEKEESISLEDYESLPDVLSDYGLRLLQGGLRIRLKEISDDARKRPRTG